MHERPAGTPRRKVRVEDARGKGARRATAPSTRRCDGRVARPAHTELDSRLIMCPNTHTRPRRLSASPACLPGHGHSSCPMDKGRLPGPSGAGASAAIAPQAEHPKAEHGSTHISAASLHITSIHTCLLSASRNGHDETASGTSLTLPFAISPTKPLADDMSP